MTLEKLMDEKYITSTYRCSTDRSNGIVEIESKPEKEYVLRIKDDDDMYVDSFEGMSLKDIEEIALDMIEYVRIMRLEINEK